LTIICVCLRVIIIVMTVINDGPYMQTTILIDALFILDHGVECVLISIPSYIVTVNNGLAGRFLISSVITALLLHVST
jgi:hypothetical protein